MPPTPSRQFSCRRASCWNTPCHAVLGCGTSAVVADSRRRREPTDRQGRSVGCQGGVSASRWLARVLPLCVGVSRLPCHPTPRGTGRWTPWSGLLDFRPEERRVTLAAFLVLFGWLAAHTILETGRDALFLARLPAHELAWIYLAMAALAVLFTRTKASRLAGGRSLAVLLAVSAGGTLIFWAAPLSGPWGLRALYVWTGLAAALISVAFWLLLGEIYTITQARRLYAAIGLGSQLGAMAGAAVARGMAERPRPAPHAGRIGCALPPHRGRPRALPHRRGAGAPPGSARRRRPPSAGGPGGRAPPIPGSRRRPHPALDDRVHPRRLRLQERRRGGRRAGPARELLRVLPPGVERALHRHSALPLRLADAHAIREPCAGGVAPRRDAGGDGRRGRRRPGRSPAAQDRGRRAAPLAQPGGGRAAVRAGARGPPGRGQACDRRDRNARRAGPGVGLRPRRGRLGRRQQADRGRGHPHVPSLGRRRGGAEAALPRRVPCRGPGGRAPGGSRASASRPELARGPLRSAQQPGGRRGARRAGAPGRPGSRSAPARAPALPPVQTCRPAHPGPLDRKRARRLDPHRGPSAGERGSRHPGRCAARTDGHATGREPAAEGFPGCEPCSCAPRHSWA